MSGDPACVLVVDDDPAVLTTVAELLEEFVVDTAIDLTGARSALRRRTYQVIIVDFELPDGRGTSLLQALPPELTSQILLTGHSDYPDVRELQRAGRVLVLFKPVDPAQLLTWVRQGVIMARLAASVSRMARPASDRLPGQADPSPRPGSGQYPAVKTDSGRFPPLTPRPPSGGTPMTPRPPSGGTPMVPPSSTPPRRRPDQL